MNDMKNLASNTKKELLSDLLLCITYEKDRENDLLCMAEQYGLYPEKRKELEDTMLKLLQGHPYENPYQSYYYYGQNHIMQLDEILTGFAEEMVDTKNPKLALENVIVQISELHDKCYGELIDEWRSPKLETYLLAVADFAEAGIILESNKRW